MQHSHFEQQLRQLQCELEEQFDARVDRSVWMDPLELLYDYAATVRPPSDGSEVDGLTCLVLAAQSLWASYGEARSGVYFSALRSLRQALDLALRYEYVRAPEPNGTAVTGRRARPVGDMPLAKLIEVLERNPWLEQGLWALKDVLNDAEHVKLGAEDAQTKNRTAFPAFRWLTSGDGLALPLFGSQDIPRDVWVIHQKIWGQVACRVLFATAAGEPHLKERFEQIFGTPQTISCPMDMDDLVARMWASAPKDVSQVEFLQLGEVPSCCVAPFKQEKGSLSLSYQLPISVSDPQITLWRNHGSLPIPALRPQLRLRAAKLAMGKLGQSEEVERHVASLKAIDTALPKDEDRAICLLLQEERWLAEAHGEEWQKVKRDLAEGWLDLFRVKAQPLNGRLTPEDKEFHNGDTGQT